MSAPELGAGVPPPISETPQIPCDEPRTSQVLKEADAEAAAARVADSPGRCSSRLLKIEQCLDRAPFPPSIRPLSCLRKPGCAFRLCEASPCCFACGRSGFELFGHFRKLLLLLSLGLSLIGACLRALPAAALSSDRGTLHEWPWALGRYTCLQTDKCAGLEDKDVPASPVHSQVAGLCKTTNLEKLVTQRPGLISTYDRQNTSCDKDAPASKAVDASNIFGSSCWDAQLPAGS
ncbi:unnamed protein product [Effrenium voratum]|nr:unnamed protein product [Effrenium voratum]